MLAYFGWPKAYEDQAERAVRAAFSSIDKISRLPTKKFGHLECRIGIATGEVVVGDLNRARSK